MSVVEVVELEGISSKSWIEAVNEALKSAAEAGKHVVGIHILEFTGDVKDNKVERFRSRVKIAFTAER